MSKLAIPVAGLMFAVWAVYLGGLASLQSQCADDGTSNMVGVDGINGSLPCHKVYRLYWFFASWEIFVIVAIAGAAATGRIMRLTNAFMGLLAVATIMFILASNTFLSALDQDPEGTMKNRIRTITAGSIMVATMNSIAILALGHTETVADKEVEEKPVAAV